MPSSSTGEWTGRAGAVARQPLSAPSAKPVRKAVPALPARLGVILPGLSALGRTQDEALPIFRIVRLVGTEVENSATEEPAEGVNHVGRREGGSAGGQSIDRRGGNILRAVEADIAVAKIIGENEQDVRPGRDS